MAFYQTGSKIGADPNNTSTTALFTLGDHFIGSQGTEFVYVYFATGCTAYKAVVYSNTYTATGGEATNLLLGYGVGWTQATVAAGDYGWVAIRGMVTVMTSGSCTVSPNGIFLPGASGTTGIISVNYSASGTLSGITFCSIGTQTTGATIVGAFLSWPRGGAPGQ